VNDRYEQARSSFEFSSVARLARKYWIGIIAGMVGGAVLAFFWPAKYSSQVLLLIDHPSEGSSLAGLLGDQGLALQGALGSLGSTENGYAYVEVVRSRSLLEDVLRTQIWPNRSLTYLDAVIPSNRTMEERLEMGVSKLRRSISAKYELRSGTLSITTKHRDPTIASGIANVIVAQLRRFNLEVRSTKAKAAVDFVSGRLSESQNALAQAENRLAAFQAANARIGNAPILELQQRRLERDLKLSEGAYELLARQLELARIQEKRESPVFTVVDSATPIRTVGRLSIVMGAILGALFSGIGVLLLDGLSQAVVLRPLQGGAGAGPS